MPIEGRDAIFPAELLRALHQSLEEARTKGLMDVVLLVVDSSEHGALVVTAEDRAPFIDWLMNGAFASVTESMKPDDRDHMWRMIAQPAPDGDVLVLLWLPNAPAAIAVSEAQIREAAS